MVFVCFLCCVLCFCVFLRFCVFVFLMRFCVFVAFLCFLLRFCVCAVFLCFCTRFLCFLCSLYTDVFIRIKSIWGSAQMEVLFTYAISFF